MIEINKVFAKNAFSIGKNGIELDLTKGLTVIFGENGEGKSTIFDILYFALTGKPYRHVKKNSIINRINKKDFEVKTILLKNKDKYEICRRIKPKGGKEPEYILKNDEKLDIIDKREFQNEVEKILGFDEKTLRQVVFLSQNFYEPFTDLGLNDKRKFISKIFGLEKFKEMEINIKNDIKEMKNKIDILKVEIDGIKKTIKYAKEKQLEMIKNLNQKLSNEKKILDEKNKEFVNLKSKLFDIDENSFEKKEDELMNMKLQKRSLEDELEKLNNLLYKIEIENKKKEDLTIEINEVKEELNKSKKEFDDLGGTDKLDQFKKIKPTIEKKINNIILNIKEETSSIKLDINKINYYKKTSICEECESLLSDEFKKTKIETLTQNIKEKHENIKLLYTQKNSYLGKIYKINNKINKMMILMNDIGDKQIIISELTNEYKSYCQEDKKLTKQKLKECDNEINKIIVNIKKFEETIKDDREKDRINKQLNIKISSLLQQIKNCEKNINEYANEIEKYNNADDIHEFEKDHEEKTIKYKKLNMRFEYSKRILNMIGDKGIKQYIVNQYLPLLNQYIKKYSKMMNFEDTIHLIDGGMNIVTYNRGVEKELNLYSGGERQQINISILLSFLKLMRTKSGINLSLLILDEITAPFDMNNVISFYKILKEEFKDMTVLIISHKLLENNLDLIDKSIEVKKNIRGFSEYTIDKK